MLSGIFESLGVSPGSFDALQVLQLTNANLVQENERLQQELSEATALVEAIRDQVLRRRNAMSCKKT